MANTRGFEVVLEAGQEVLRKVLRGAWKSAECPDAPGDEGRIPEFLDIPEDTGPLSFGGYNVVDGQIQIPQNELDASFVADQGVELKFGLHMQLEVADPPVPSAGFFDMTADVRALTPVGTLPDSLNVGLLLDGLPRGNVTTALTSGDPLAAKLDQLLAEFVHKAYENGAPGGAPDPNFPTLPHEFVEVDKTWPTPVGNVTVDVYSEIYDDPTDPPHRIEVSRPNATTLNISIPVYLRIHNIEENISLLTLRDPMAIETRMIISAPFESPPGSYTGRLSMATVSVVEPLTPAPGIEGANYTYNTSLPLIGTYIANQIASGLQQQGTQLAQSFGDFTIQVPTQAQIEATIGDLFHLELESRDFIAVWTPETAGEEFQVDNVTVKVLTDALVIALNAGGGADVNAMQNFIPADREFAIAIDGARVQAIIDQTRVENGFADGDLPKRFKEDGKDVDLRELDVFLANGAIRMEGEVTVIDAILGSIDVDADFRVDVGLHWNPNADLSPEGTQMMEHHIIGEPEVDPEESVALWVITVILAVLTFGAGGVIGVLIVVIVALIVRAIAESIGSSMAVDPITNALRGITAWPPQLARIGRVRAVFHDPIEIAADGIVIAGLLEVISSCEQTAVVPADSGSAYTVQAASAVLLAANNTHPDALYRWLAGDGSPEVMAQDELHTYAASGLYIAKHALTVNQVGGATSRHFALVNAANVPPGVDAGPDRTVNEGEVVTLVGRFWDVEYPDTHESTWNFGDSQTPQPGVIQETNDPPQAVGTSTVQHAWCDNGEYTVTLRVRDQNGGMAVDTLRVTVLNVPPRVEAGPPLFAYPCTVITLVGRFTDPGWCDTHRGRWDFGDCTPPQTAILRETHAPPAGVGEAIASHVYERCGTYQAACTVVDDDGGVGESATLIRVVEVRNAGFEGGFREGRLGSLANDWRPFLAAAETFPPREAPPPEPGGPIFYCEECLVHGGQRSQRLLVPASLRAGLYQQIGSNPGWDYQVSAWYSAGGPGSGSAWLGIDSEGGTDPAAPSVRWTSGSEPDGWAQLAERVTARGNAITIFLQASAPEKEAADFCFDDVALLPIQPFCPPELPQPEEPQPKETCVDFAALQPGSELPPVYEKGGFVFTAPDQKPQRVLAWGEPVGQSKLELRAAGLRVELPFPADRVRVRVYFAGGRAVELRAFDQAGNEVGQATGATGANALQSFEISAPGIVQLEVSRGGREALLVDVCVRQDWRAASPARPEGGRRAALESLSARGAAFRASLSGGR